MILNEKRIAKNLLDIFQDSKESDWKKVSHYRKLIDTLFDDIIVPAVVKGEVVRLAGFGNFRKQQRKERRGRNPQTGEIILIPEMSVIKFRASIKFRKRVKGN